MLYSWKIWRILTLVLCFLFLVVIYSAFLPERGSREFVYPYEEDAPISQPINIHPAPDISDQKMALFSEIAKNVRGKSLQIEELIQELIGDVSNVSGDGKKASRNLVFIQRKLASDLEEFAKERDEERKKELKILQEIVEKRIHNLQNPPHCDSGRRLICQLEIRCGLGCLLHHYAICFSIALGTNRTMTIDLSRANYMNMAEVFVPVSQTCPLADAFKAVEWQGETTEKATPDDVAVVKVTVRGAFYPTTQFAPQTVPSGILERLSRCHDDPNVWWIGQLMKFLTRVQAPILKVIEEDKRKIGFSHPVVGVHIRRTDKLIKEAKYHGAEEYMKHVIAWFDRHDMATNTMATRKVFVATDEPQVIEEFKKYTNYTIIRNPHVAGRNIVSRFTNSGLVDIVSDLKLLSQCDYFVGTHSSNIGRLVYELMQADGDRTYDAVSIDSNYFFLGGHNREFKAIQSHKPLDGEMELQPGDRIIAGGYDAFAWSERYGRNTRTKQKGMFPMSKVEQILLPADYPGISYPEHS